MVQSVCEGQQEGEGKVGVLRERFVLKRKTKKKHVTVFVSVITCAGFSVMLPSIVSSPHVNQRRLEGLWWGGGSNTAQYCFLSPHVEPGNEAVSCSPYVCFRNLLSTKSNEQI